jgi:hypothetical protein
MEVFGWVVSFYYLGPHDDDDDDARRLKVPQTLNQRHMHVNAVNFTQGNWKIFARMCTCTILAVSVKKGETESASYFNKYHFYYFFQHRHLCTHTPSVGREGMKIYMHVNINLKP